MLQYNKMSVPLQGVSTSEGCVNDRRVIYIYIHIYIWHYIYSAIDHTVNDIRRTDKFCVHSILLHGRMVVFVVVGLYQRKCLDLLNVVAHIKGYDSRPICVFVSRVTFYYLHNCTKLTVD